MDLRFNRGYFVISYTTTYYSPVVLWSEKLWLCEPKERKTLFTYQGNCLVDCDWRKASESLQKEEKKKGS